MSRAFFRNSCGVLRFEIVVLGRLPEIVPNHEAVFVGESVEVLFRVLAHPVANDVDVRVAMQAEEWFEMADADALAAVVHAPVATARGDAHAVDLDDEIGAGPSAVDGLDGRGVFRPWRERVHPGMLHPIWQRLAGGHQVGGLIVDLTNALMAIRR